MNKYFAICPRGLEELLADELRGMAAKRSRRAWRLLCRRLEHLLPRQPRVAYRDPHPGGIVKGRMPGEDIYRLAVRQLWPNHFTVSNTMRVVTTAIAPAEIAGFRDPARQGRRLRPLP